MKLGLSLVGNFYIVCGLLQNARTFLYENKVLEYFDLEPMTIQVEPMTPQEYFQ